MSSSIAGPAFWILTALAAGRKHGYEIMRDTETDSAGLVTLKVTTLYATLDRLERDGLISADGEEIVGGRARRYYRLTETGTARLVDDLEVLERTAAVAHARLAATRPGVSRPATARIATARVALARIATARVATARVAFQPRAAL
jgi:DNA-binding PadR family transcriptional regulator